MSAFMMVNDSPGRVGLSTFPYNGMLIINNYKKSTG